MCIIMQAERSKDWNLVLKRLQFGKKPVHHVMYVLSVGTSKRSKNN